MSNFFRLETGVWDFLGVGFVCFCFYSLSINQLCEIFTVQA